MTKKESRQIDRQYKYPTAKFPATSDNFKLDVDCIRQAPIRMREGDGGEGKRLFTK